MFKLISIDPGKCKCGLVFAEINEKKIYKAIIIKSEFLEDYVRELNTVEDISKIKTLLRKTRDKIMLRGSIVKEINTRGDFIKKIIDSLETNQNSKYRLEVVSLKDSKTVEPVIVDLSITKI